MIEIEAYRARIGSFCAAQQRKRTGSKTRRCGFGFHNNSYNHEVYTNILHNLIVFVFIITLKFNINMAFLKVSLLLIAGDIESNPGPVDHIRKAVLGSFHQGNDRFGNSSGNQCTCNALYAICFSLIKKVNIWKSWDLDYVLDHGDALYKTIVGTNTARPLFLTELPNQVEIENEIVNIEMLSNHYGLLSQNNIFQEHAPTCDVGNGLIFTTNGFSIALIWTKSGVFLFDSHSRDKYGAFTDDGKSVILSFKSLYEVQGYIKAEYENQFPTNFATMQFELLYIRVCTSESGALSISNSLKKFRKKAYNQMYHGQCSLSLQCKRREKHAELFGTPEHEKIKEQKCQKRAELFGTPGHDKMKANLCQKRAELFGTPEHEKMKAQKCQKRAELFGTPEHDKMKANLCQKRAELFGTPGHDKMKANLCQKRAELFGTPEHEKMKAQKCQKRVELFGTPEHDKMKANYVRNVKEHEK